MAQRRLFYILDGHALAYRNHFAMINAPFKTASGEVTSAVYGFARTLIELLNKEKSAYLAVAFDEGLTGRDQLFPAYKGTREKMPDELQTQIVRIQQLVAAFNIPILSLPDHEADDLIGTVSRQAVEQGAAVRIFTGDRDLLQLLDEDISVRLFIPKAKAPDEIYDIPRFRERYGLEPRQLIDLKALEGDTSDNIPGVAGIGEKTATTLLQSFHSIEEIYANLDAISGSVRKKLEAGREMAFLSKRLATILRDVDYALDLPACAAMEFERAPVEAFFRELQFNSLISSLDKLSPMPVGTGQQMAMFEPATVPVALPPAEPIVAFTIVDTAEGLAELVQTLNTAQMIAFDTETTGLDQMAADLVGICLAVDGDHGFYVPVGHEVGPQLPRQTVLDALLSPLTNPHIPKVAHNALYDLIILQRHGIPVTPIATDTMILSWVRDTFDSELGLKRLVREILDRQMTEIQELIGKGKSQITMAQAPIVQAAPYGAADAACTWALVEPLQARLAAVPLLVEDRAGVHTDALWGTPQPPSPRELLERIEMPLVPVLSQMQRAGVLLDTAALASMSVRLGELLAGLEADIHGMSGGYGPFNINSPIQLADVLFGKIGLSAAGVRKTSTGKFSTAADVLETLLGQHPIIEKIMEYRELTKLKSTYVDALSALINPATGRVHTSYNQTGAGTGRLSSSNPNLQNIPVRTEIGREVRRAFIAPDGHVLLSVDYSQVELRIMAHVSQDASLLAAFAQGQDIHAATAALINQVPIEAVTKPMRNFAKRINFGILYGMGAFRLARDSDMTLAQASAFIETYFRQLPGVKAYLERAKALAREPGYLTTLFGRRRSFPAMTGGNHNARTAAEREAINMPIQGTAADIMKKAMIEVAAALEKSRLPVRMLLQVHDELVLEVPEGAAAEAAALVTRVMEEACVLRAPLKANAAAGPNWRDGEAIAP